MISLLAATTLLGTYPDLRIDRQGAHGRIRLKARVAREMSIKLSGTPSLLQGPLVIHFFRMALILTPCMF